MRRPSFLTPEQRIILNLTAKIDKLEQEVAERDHIIERFYEVMHIHNGKR